MLEYRPGTGLPVTWTGEAESGGSAYGGVRRKCEMGSEIYGVDYALASEGSFGFPGFTPFRPRYHEVLHFIDRRRDCRLSITHHSEKTNYRMQVVDALEELEEFAARAKFPSHAPVLQPNDDKDKGVVFEGINTQDGLETAFEESLRHSKYGKVWVQTDMRAHMNPSRMAVIGEVGDHLARRLATACPACGAPGWGSIGVGGDTLRAETDRMVAFGISGCVLCRYTEAMPHLDETLARSQGHGVK